MKKITITTTILIGLLFFLMTSEYLSWFYNLGDGYDTEFVDLAGQILGYIFQAIGMAAYCLYVRFRRNEPAVLTEFAIVIAANYLMAVLSIAPPHFGNPVFMGFIMNITIGILYSWFIIYEVRQLSSNCLAISFGAGMALSCIFSFIMYLLDQDNSFVKSIYCLYFYAIVSIISGILVYINNGAGTLQSAPAGDLAPNPVFLMLLFVFSINIVKGMGFFLPVNDNFTYSMNPEVMRLFYAFGLVLAGYLIEKNRKIGLILTFIALSFTFAMPLLRESLAGIYITWALSYIFMGFINVYCAIILIDAAVEKGSIWLAPLGLATARIGQPIGEYIRVRLSFSNAYLLLALSIFFAISIVLFAVILSKIYLKNEDSGNTIDYPALFYEKYDISAREVEILNEILLAKTNKEIAASLFITEATVKFHVKNLMKKTGCKNRNELIKLYNHQCPASNG